MIVLSTTEADLQTNAGNTDQYCKAEELAFEQLLQDFERLRDLMNIFQ
jgi:hypothetical protein